MPARLCVPWHERVVWKSAEYARPLPPAEVEEREGIFKRLLVGQEPIDVGRLIRVQERWVVFGEYPLHAVDRDGIAVGKMDDQLLDRPVAGARVTRSGHRGKGPRLPFGEYDRLRRTIRLGRGSWPASPVD